MPSVDDQFNMGRVPLRPLPYKNKDLATCSEIMVDYGEDTSTYHIYITHHSDKTKVIDLTNKIINEIIPNAPINANQFQITIEGIKDPTSLKDLINFIYKRFVYPDNMNGFDYDRDITKVFDPTTKSVLLRNTDGTYILPVTSTDNVYDKSGTSIQDRLDSMTRLGFGMTYIYTTSQDQSTFEFDYPFQNYSDYLEVRIGTTFVDKTRYQISNITDGDGNYTSGTITFIGETVEKGRRIDILFMYNALAKSDGKYEYMYGGNIANASISAIKLEKTSDSYTLADSSSIATSKAVYNLYQHLSTIATENIDSAVWALDNTTVNNVISVKLTEDITAKDVCFLSVLMKSNKVSNTAVKLTVNGTAKTKNILNPDGTALTRGFMVNKNIKLLWVKEQDRFFLVSSGATITSSRFIYTCTDQETVISYKSLSYNTGDLITVYRNGVRLFQDLDYSVNEAKEEITLYVRTEDGERIVFETISA